MTDYKNELRSVLYDFLGDYKDKRYLSEGNTDQALAAIEALLAERELEARLNEIKSLVIVGGKYGWGEPSTPEFKYLQGRYNQLTNREDK